MNSKDLSVNMHKSTTNRSITVSNFNKLKFVENKLGLIQVLICKLELIQVFLNKLVLSLRVCEKNLD